MSREPDQSEWALRLKWRRGRLEIGLHRQGLHWSWLVALLSVSAVIAVCVLSGGVD